MTQEKNYIFGPVPSRRLGLSLGVDVVPFKVCTLDCVYCQVGCTTRKTVERQAYIPIDTLLNQLRSRLHQGVQPDYITLSGSGEPTLNAHLGELIEGIRRITSVPVALITNATLLDRTDVLADCCKADLILPSLDAALDASFNAINRPHAAISTAHVIEGLVSLRQAFRGQIWLEIFLIEGINTSAQDIEAIKQAIARIKPDKVQLNTAVRPTAQLGILRTHPETMERIRLQIGGECEIIASFQRAPSTAQDGGGQEILTMLRRRPCSLTDVCDSLGLTREKASEELHCLLQQGLLKSEERGGVLFYVANEDREGKSQ